MLRGGRLHAQCPPHVPLHTATLSLTMRSNTAFCISQQAQGTRSSGGLLSIMQVKMILRS